MEKNDERALAVLRKYLEVRDAIAVINQKIADCEGAPIGAVSRNKIKDLYGRRDAMWKDAEHRLRGLRAWRSGENLAWWAVANSVDDPDDVPQQ